MHAGFRSVRFDSELAKIMQARDAENANGFTLIPSENHPDPNDVAAFRDAVVASFEGGYFEGYSSDRGPGKGRYYQGCEAADQLETLARKRVLAVMGQNVGADQLAANVQVPTGAGANLSVYLSVMKPGDRMVAPSLGDAYGHLSHGGGESPNVVARLFDVKSYGADPETGLIDYDTLERLVREHQPRVVVGGGSSYPRDMDWARVAAIANEVGAVSLADISHPAGLVAAGLLKDPFSSGIDVVTMTTHKTLGGMKGAVIVWNKEAIARKAGAGTSLMKVEGIDFGVFPGIWGGPHMPTIAAHASTFRRTLTPKFKELQGLTHKNAAALAQALKENGWEVITGGTDNHLVLVDITTNSRVQNSATRDGWEAAILLEQQGIVANKNSVPHRTQIRGVDGTQKRATPMRPPGLRLGTPAISTRGMQPDDVQQVGQLIHDTLAFASDATRLASIREEVRRLAHRFPLPDYR